jgi:hypothetical protein
VKGVSTGSLGVEHAWNSKLTSTILVSPHTKIS